MVFRQRLAVGVLLLFAMQGIAPLVASAGPPSYLLLRQPESPGPYHHPGYPSAARYDVRSCGYAYGYFGVTPRMHASRHFGFYRDYTQWSWR